MSWYLVILFCAAFSATVVAVPEAIRLARRFGMLDAPDGFRKHHAAVTPRVGGLAVLFGIVCALGGAAACLPAVREALVFDLGGPYGTLFVALALILFTGVVDDRRGLSPATKLALQGLAALCLFADGYRIEQVFVFGGAIDFGWLSLPATVFWFLACMNIWNLIDGMDGLASGVGLLVTLTLVAAAISMGHVGVACAGVALAGALAGFLMFNFHPASVFLGDTGSLLIGTLLGMLAIRGSLKSGMTVAILVPVLTMGLPIVDTFLAIVRRWLRHLPMGAADRGHLHHRLIAFGLSTRQAAVFLYSFTGILCAGALVSIATHSDSLAVAFAGLGTLCLTFVYAARLEEFGKLWGDFRRRVSHRRKAQKAARTVWEAIQRLDSCEDLPALVAVAAGMAEGLDCDLLGVEYRRRGRPVLLAELRTGGHLHAAERRSELRLSRSGTAEEPAAEDWTLALGQGVVGRSAVPLTLAGTFVPKFFDAWQEAVRDCRGDWLPAAGTPVGDCPFTVCGDLSRSHATEHASRALVAGVA